ncbi:MAG: VacB/RNase II family 3'-5' exoribonuclease, partial [Deltaproteobacteria bacterium]|nr:VacB/RNase II family 3'-5' exoribonuclease [Deltaproteobacteria bacterium]
KRERSRIAGTVERRGGSHWLLPDDPHLPELMPIIPGEHGEAVSGQAVVAEPLTESGLTRVRVVEVLGQPGEPEVEEAKLAHLFGLRQHFSAEALAEAAALQDGAGKGEALGGEERLDLRGCPLVTIDPPDARDFDDALAIAELADGGFSLTVAIADVAHYVAPGSVIDQEAKERGCSVYFPGRVIPMLPAALSGDLCSLKPGAERLAVAVQLRFAADGTQHAARIEPALVRSRARLTYDGVAALLAGQPLPRDPANEHAEQLRQLERLARLLLRHRVAGGALDLDIPEARAVWDAQVQQVVDIERCRRTWAHRLVEEMMLAANRAVGARLQQLGRPAPWRIHEPPDPADLAEVAALAEALLPVSGRPAAVPGEISGMLRWVRQHLGSGPGAEVLAQRLLRAMKQARYSAVDVGHFALAARGYLHFTSPIRRYPDLIVHRLLRGEAPEPASLAQLAEHCSRRERAAMAAEQAALQLHGTLLLQEMVGEPLPGTITGIGRGGLFVQLERPFVQGMVLAGNLPDDRYDVAPLGHLAVGRRTGQTFRLGDRLQVIVDAVSPLRRHVDLRLA